MKEKFPTPEDLVKNSTEKKEGEEQKEKREMNHREISQLAEEMDEYLQGLRQRTEEISGELANVEGDRTEELQQELEDLELEIDGLEGWTEDIESGNYESVSIEEDKEQE